MKLKSFIFGLLALAAAVGCTEVLPEPKLSINRTVAEVSAAGDEVIVEVTSNVEWTAAADADWVTSISPSAGKASDSAVSVFITVAANESDQDREAVVTFSAGALKKTLTVTQAAPSGSEDGPVEGQDSDLFVAWAFSEQVKALNSETWHQSSNDLAAGFADKYLSASKGSGKIQYYQEAKSGFEGKTDEMRRHTGSSGEPMAYGIWVGDYFLFEADCNLPANSNVSISFGMRGKANALLYWLLEYKDGDSWKPAGDCDESLAALGINSNVVCGKNTEEETTVVNQMVVLTQATEKVEFRLKCVSNISLAGGELTEPASDTYVRIAPEHKIIIKGGAITDADKEGIIAPSFSLKGDDGEDISNASVEAEGGNVSLLINSNMDWEVSSDVDWASVLPFGGPASANDVSVAVTVEENTSEEPRGGKITFTAEYGNLTFTKELAVSQTGKQPEQVEGTDSDLFVAWTFSDDLLDQQKESFVNNGNDYAAGDAGKYIQAALGTGKFSFVQLAKEAGTISDEQVLRSFHAGSGDPAVYGAWVGDYFLFDVTAESQLPANSNVSISFKMKPSNTKQMKYWMLEYEDGEGVWKSALPQEAIGDVFYNYSLNDNSVHSVSADVVLTKATSTVRFRMRCVSDISIGNKQNQEYRTSAIRIDSETPIIIKGGAITDSDVSSVLKPAISLDKTTESAVAAGGEVALAVTSNMDWTATSDVAWATLSSNSGEGSASASNLTVTVAENESAEARTATITVAGTYGKVSVPKTLVITQAAKATEPDPEPEPEPEQPKLVAKWEWNANGTGDTQTDAEKALQAANEGSFKQTANDLSSGDSDKYIAATTGTGRLTYVQVDKTGFTVNNKTVYRHVGKNGEPVIYGVYEGDYFLFEVDSQAALAAGSKFNIQLGLYGSEDTSMKYWTLEYKDGDAWVPAIETSSTNGATYNVTSSDSAVTVSGTAVLSQSTNKVSVRLRCSSKIMLNGESADKPQKKWTRLAPTTHVVISQE